MESLIKAIREEFISIFSLLKKPHKFTLEELRIRLRKLHNLLLQLFELEYDINRKVEVKYALEFVDSVYNQIDYVIPETLIPFAKEQLKYAVYRFNLYYT
ncbi:hypothetical protein [Acidianus bottle-shaped virus]|uniref:Uncharacterized protein ORF99b n=1 Tax=Acidianus bottle-shaped virus (isolate Italy/Pozzuoli) TaxID=654911 RepID=Y099B_ABVP|nr:hypothetical protein ABV_gp03 [Acidianus bottle-shaped virus]A4ZU89.1 RecName: Full=Uncharacterized protein ORF99b [Acidianus bottle-shaped virus (isolate Pozzuoli)]ABP73393.1 hypothetical protein [Acidianus bottle-shaped virus]